MSYRGITTGSPYWNALLSGNLTLGHLVYAELGNPAKEELRFTNTYKNVVMDAPYSFTFVDIDTWQVTGVDATAYYTTGKRLRFIDGANSYYGTVSSSSFATNTTVEMTMEGGDNLTATISAVYRTQSGDLSGIYNSAGGLLSLSPFEESLALNVNELEVSMDGVTGVAISDLLNWRYLDRKVKIWQGLLDANEAPITDPILLLDGRISGASVINDPEKGVAKVAIKVSSQWADFERRGGSRTNNADHQRHYPGDLGFEFAAASKAHLYWGRERTGKGTFEFDS